MLPRAQERERTTEAREAEVQQPPYLQLRDGADLRAAIAAVARQIDEERGFWRVCPHCRGTGRISRYAR
jgi:hypothetical protein